MNEWERGVLDAASVADQYNGSTTHPFRLGDCVAGKLNVGRAKPRRNKAKLENPADAFLRGFALGLVEMHGLLIAAGHDAGLCKVAREAGLTLAEARRVGLLPDDIKRLRRAGVR